MARIRTIKPDFFRHEGLYDSERQCGFPLRVAFAGLFTAADREGRFAWSPRTLKLDCLPHDDLDFEDVLNALCSFGFIVKYEVDGRFYGAIPTFLQHQHVNVREAESRLPAPTGASTCKNIPSRGEGKGREQEGKGREGVARKRAKTKIPEDWKPPERATGIASEINVSVSDTEARFRDYIASTGKLYADYDAAFCNFVRNAPKFNGVQNGKATSNLVTAGRELVNEIRAFGRPSGIRGEESDSAIRLLPQDGSKRSENLHDGSDGGSG